MKTRSAVVNEDNKLLNEVRATGTVLTHSGVIFLHIALNWGSPAYLYELTAEEARALTSDLQRAAAFVNEDKS